MASLENQSFEDEIHSLPSVGMENLTTREGRLHNVAQEQSLNLECCIPVIVVKYMREQHLVYVQPLVDIGGSESMYLVRGRFWTSLMRHHCGNYLVDIPLKESELEDESDYDSKITRGGDTGWVIASDRNTYNAKAYNPEEPGIGYETMNGPQPLASSNLHSHADGFFIPDRWNFFPLEEDDLENDRMVIQSANGKQRISIYNGEEDDGEDGDIKIYSASIDEESGSEQKTFIHIQGGNVTIESEGDVKMEINGDVEQTVDGDVTQEVGGDVTQTVTGAVSLTAASLAITAPTTITGTLTVSGLITGSSDVKDGGSGVTLGTHVHISSQSGTPTSGPR